MPDIDSDSCLNIDRAVWKDLYPFRFKCPAEAGVTLFIHTSFVKKDLTWNSSLENITIVPQVTYYSGNLKHCHNMSFDKNISKAGNIMMTIVN